VANPLAGKKTITLTVAGVIAAITAAVQYPPIMAFLQGQLSAHPQVWAVIAGIGGILALFHNPTPTPGS